MLQPVHAAVARAGATPARSHPAGARDHGFPPRHVAAALLASVVASAALMMQAGLRVTGDGRVALALALGIVLVIVLRSRRVTNGWRHGAALRDGAGYYALFTGIALAGAVTSYPIAASTHGYADPMLQRIDLALGFDWLTWYRAVAAHPVLQVVGTACYQSIYVTPAILLGWFARTGERAEAHRFLASFWLAAVVTLALFALMPAVGPLSYLWHGPLPYLPASETWQSDLIPALRARRVGAVDLGALRGLVSAPSFHAAAGTIYLSTAWRTPPLRLPLIGLIAAMLLSTPVEGTHYLVDMILGAGVARIAMEAVDLALARTRRRAG
ncbi:phosphatase PAP2 family protein [Sphingomonas sp. A2-49]|uniref:phosphatase PAP2 family protein n=1 Tax=Sphingomonas sp. A2-49 TaxID=1391375 RepID=UPI0021D28E08|nr:phosphatase PAP2 family protein [Sphingomonas sp. A2-49]MCU6455917.1 phosphatase PAP2 family protein [Sphingomonas sp. A2-49]